MSSKKPRSYQRVVRTKGEVVDYDVGGEYFEVPSSPDPCSGNYTRSSHTTEHARVATRVL